VTPEKRKLVRYRLQRAQEALDEAVLLHEKGHLNACINRLHYACFYAVSALLLMEEKSSSKHSGVRALWRQEARRFVVTVTSLAERIIREQ
jgi:uncharacterized protein (UPF0332 family)